ncbi:hypothetical protein O6H91_22G014900 [Diphasiastrum complanatum]|uniref:Uncharacterized protein n=1 Tax=Diphasiastrum complanatum TaxID=34168 RepID=A0ACC2AF44_DIPCM|nr:hypothetical protein O6H91_Y416600 [Diphasiastrum complanatum]KAJ7515484.1 hypothetical protein O6H91_22G014900 [Diphasiastrum complanatum]
MASHTKIFLALLIIFLSIYLQLATTLHLPHVGDVSTITRSGRILGSCYFVHDCSQCTNPQCEGFVPPCCPNFF